MKPIRVFVAHSFDEKPKESTKKSDEEVAKWFINMMKKSPLNFNVTTGKKPVPSPIYEKIENDIADSDCVVGIFTRRYCADNKWFPSLFILCECAYAMGLYRNSRKIFCGFYEDGIDPKDLALLTISGFEVIKFDREKLKEDKGRFIEYLEKIPILINYGSYREGQIPLEPPTYTQEYLRKIYTIYRNGYVIVQNITNMVIMDSENFINGTDKGYISHEIWLQRSNMPPFEQMIKTPIEERKEKSFLKGICRYNGEKKIDTPLLFELEKEDKNNIFLNVGFKNKDGSQLKLKNQDIITYQYAWGVPNACAKFEEELSPTGSHGEIDDNAYNHAEVVSNHGVISHLELELRFEKSDGPIFNKSPFWQYASLHRDRKKWGPSKIMPMIEEIEDEDHAMWFQTYKLKQQDFQGGIRVLWRPSSKKYVERS